MESGTLSRLQRKFKKGIDLKWSTKPVCIYEEKIVYKREDYTKKIIKHKFMLQCIIDNQRFIFVKKVALINQSYTDTENKLFPNNTY